MYVLLAREKGITMYLTDALCSFFHNTKFVNVLGVLVVMALICIISLFLFYIYIRCASVRNFSELWHIKKCEISYVLVFTCENETAEKAAIIYINQNTKENILKTKTVTRGFIKVTSEIRLKEVGADFMNELVKINGITNVSLESANSIYPV